MNTLKRCIEKVAKTAFTTNKDPLDAALFYLAMKKKTLLWGLFRYCLLPTNHVQQQWVMPIWTSIPHLGMTLDVARM